MPTSTANAKGTVTFKTVSPNLHFEGKSAAGNVTVKHKSGDVTTSLQFTDATARDLNSLKDVTLTFDYRYNNKFVFSGGYDFNNNKHKLSTTYTGTLAGRYTTAKVTYTEKNGNIATEVTRSLADNLTANVELDKASLSTAKLGLRRSGILYEPKYNFVSKSPSLTVSKKNKGTTTKASYDLKSEKASLEWSKAPFKVTLSSTVTAKGLQPSKPDVSIIYEKLYHL